MRRVVLTFALLPLACLPTLAQKIETENTDRTQIVHLKTALDHLTVIELGEPVLQVASGSPSFKVEWRENKVFIQPTEPEAQTNLFIWTASQRLNYELEPAGVVKDMDFAVDQTPLHPNPTVSLSTQPQPVQPTISDLLLEAQPVRMQSMQHGSKPVEVWISDLYEKDGHLLVRYTVFNRGTETYSVNAPLVFQLDGVRSMQSLYGLTNSQLSEEQAVGAARMLRPDARGGSGRASDRNCFSRDGVEFRANCFVVSVPRRGQVTRSVQPADYCLPGSIRIHSSVPIRCRQILQNRSMSRCGSTS